MMRFSTGVALVASLFSARVLAAAHGNEKVNFSCVFEQVSSKEGFRSGVNVHELGFSVSPKGKTSRQLALKGASADVKVSDGYLKLTVNSSINREANATATVGLEVLRAKVEMKEGKGEMERMNILLCERDQNPTSNL